MAINELLNDPTVLRELILDHYQYPHNRRLIKDNGYLHRHMTSESCIDDIWVCANIENGVIQDICFDGEACTISTASTSMMTDLLIGKTTQQAKQIIAEYQKMVHAEPYEPELLQEAVAMKNVYKQANRIKCATVGWDAIEQIIEESEGKS